MKIPKSTVINSCINCKSFYEIGCINIIYSLKLINIYLKLYLMKILLNYCVIISSTFNCYLRGKPENIRSTRKGSYF